MSLLMNYTKAIEVGAKKVGLLRSIWSVLSSRFFHGIGPLYHSTFRLFDIPSSDWHLYIDSNESNKITAKINSGKGHELARNKTLFYKHCRLNSIPTIPILGTLGGRTENAVNPITSLSDFEKLLLDCPPDIFFKISDGAHGDGAFRASRAKNGGWIIKGESLSPSSLYNLLMKNLSEENSYLVQKSLKPHKHLRPIMPGNSLGTIRIITLFDAKEPVVILPVLRIPANGNVTDNFSLGLLGNLVAPVDVKSGEIGVAKVSRRRDWPAIIDVSKHQDTGHQIAGKILPYWSETLSLVLEAQHKTPQLPTVGWDVAITDDGPLIVEANTRYGIEIHEVAYNRGVRNDLLPLLLSKLEAAKLQPENV